MVYFVKSLRCDLIMHSWGKKERRGVAEADLRRIRL